MMTTRELIAASDGLDGTGKAIVKIMLGATLEGGGAADRASRCSAWIMQQPPQFFTRREMLAILKAYVLGEEWPDDLKKYEQEIREQHNDNR